MKIITIVPARMDSTRLPGKPLTLLQGKPLLEHVLNRARCIPGVSTVVLATTARPVDDPIVVFAEQNDVEAFSGALDDVASRFLDCARHFQADAFIRVNGDSPFLDSALIGRGTGAYATGDVDFVTNLIGRTFPYGISVEIVKTAVYEQIYQRLTTDSEREHVTPYIYQHLDHFKVHSLTSPRPELSAARLTVDTPADLALLERVCKQLGLGADTVGFERAAEVYLKEKESRP
jgi:spore coat polysaccharide biosynthesis protein SpsF (cytidylyltransferase family)